MTSFDDRKKGEENKYAHQEELKFKTRVKGIKAFAAWCAGKIGVASEAYETELVNLVLKGDEDAEIIQKVLADAKGKAPDLTQHLLEEKLNRTLEEARQQVLKS